MKNIKEEFYKQSLLQIMDTMSSEYDLEEHEKAMADLKDYLYSIQIKGEELDEIIKLVIAIAAVNRDIAYLIGFKANAMMCAKI